MADLPYLFLDVDGVLNALDGLNVGDWDDFKKVKVLAPMGGVNSGLSHRFTMRLSKKMCAALASLPVEIHWATTWEHLANELLWSHTNLNDYPVACRMPPGDGLLTDEDMWWKWKGIKRIVEADPRPTIWLDDEAIPEEAGSWFQGRRIPCCLISPDCCVGLTQTHVARIREFLEMVK